MSARQLASDGYPPGTCMTCLGEGWIETGGGVDACRACARRAEAVWREWREWQRKEGK